MRDSRAAQLSLSILMSYARMARERLDTVKKASKDHSHLGGGNLPDPVGNASQP